MNNRLLLVFFVSKRRLVQTHRKNEKSLKKVLKRGQVPNTARLVVLVDKRGQENEFIQYFAIKWRLRMLLSWSCL